MLLAAAQMPVQQCLDAALCVNDSTLSTAGSAPSKVCLSVCLPALTCGAVRAYTLSVLSTTQMYRPIHTQPQSCMRQRTRAMRPSVTHMQGPGLQACGALQQQAAGNKCTHSHTQVLMSLSRPLPAMLCHTCMCMTYIYVKHTQRTRRFVARCKQTSRSHAHASCCISITHTARHTAGQSASQQGSSFLYSLKMAGCNS
jgi:hypothetical protein